MDHALGVLAQRLGAQLVARRQTLATAESCTGGLLGAVLTSVAGSSQWYERGLITYSNEAKRTLLGVSAEVLLGHGAVSGETARAMVEGLLARAPVDYAVAITGIAGPGGGSPDKPVGTVWFGFAARQGRVVAERTGFSGDRAAIRHAAVEYALLHLLKITAST